MNRANAIAAVSSETRPNSTSRSLDPHLVPEDTSLLTRPNSLPVPIHAPHPLAPVAGFGWLLLVQGLATCTAEDRWLRRLYVATYGLVLLYSEVPWTELALLP